MLDVIKETEWSNKMSTEKKDGLICISLKGNDGRTVKNLEGIYQSLQQSNSLAIVSADKNKIMVRIKHLPASIDSVAPKVRFVAIDKKEQKKKYATKRLLRRNKDRSVQTEEALLDVSGFLVKA